jgi:hypothetical protein
VEDKGQQFVCFYCGWQYTTSHLNQRCPKCQWDDSQCNRLQGIKTIGIDPKTGQPDEFFQKLAAEPLRPIVQEAQVSSTTRKGQKRGRKSGPMLVRSKSDVQQRLDKALTAFKDYPGTVSITELAREIGWSRGTLYKYARVFEINLPAYRDHFRER